MDSSRKLSIRSFSVLLLLLTVLQANVILSQQSLEVEGALKLGTVSTNSLENTDEGVIRYNSVNKDFEGWNGSKWVSLTTGLKRGEVIDIDGNEYQTILIGEQEWMAENLYAIHFRNGDLIAFPHTNTQWSELITAALTFVNNSSNNSYDYGILYNWYSTVDPRGLCPIGWEIPNRTQWETLRTFLGGSSLAGLKMKESGLEHWESKSTTTGMENSSGFTGRGAGKRRGDTGIFVDFQISCYWWSKTEYSNNEFAFNKRLFSSINSDQENIDYKQAGLSVRCLKTEE